MTQIITSLPINQIRFVKELYPRVREDDAAIERYRAAIDKLPPIAVARDGLLVDGYHRWQAHLREGIATIQTINLGDLADVEILKESIRRNSSHGRQLETSDRRKMADKLYRDGVKDEADMANLLSITLKTLKEYLRDAKRDEKEEQKATAWDLWLNCLSYRQVGEIMDVDHKTVAEWCGEKSNELGNSPPHADRDNPWGVVQHFDVWSPKNGDDGSYFGRMPKMVVENLLWFFTDPGDIVVDPFAGSGTTIDVAKAMGRRPISSPDHLWDQHLIGVSALPLPAW